MKFFKKRSVALILCVLLVLVSTLVNTRWKLGSQAQRVSAVFYDEDGVAPQLEIILAEGDTLAAVAERYGLDIGGLRESTGSLRLLLQRRSLDTEQMYWTYDALRYELRSTEQKLLAAALSEGDASAVSASLERIRSAQSAMSASSYNSLARRFLTRNGSTLTRAMARLAGVAMPEVFA